jgi:hypothetical protein
VVSGWGGKLGGGSDLRLGPVSLELAFVELEQELKHPFLAQVDGRLRRKAPGVGLEVEPHEARVQAAQLDGQRVEPVLSQVQYLQFCEKAEVLRQHRRRVVARKAKSVAPQQQLRERLAAADFAADARDGVVAARKNLEIYEYRDGRRQLCQAAQIEEK